MTELNPREIRSSTGPKNRPDRAIRVASSLRSRGRGLFALDVPPLAGELIALWVTTTTPEARCA